VAGPPSPENPSHPFPAIRTGLPPLSSLKTEFLPVKYSAPELSIAKPPWVSIRTPPDRGESCCGCTNAPQSRNSMGRNKMDRDLYPISVGCVPLPNCTTRSEPTVGNPFCPERVIWATGIGVALSDFSYLRSSAFICGPCLLPFSGSQQSEIYFQSPYPPDTQPINRIPPPKTPPGKPEFLGRACYLPLRKQLHRLP